MLNVGDELRYNVYYYTGSQSDVIGSSAFDAGISTHIYEQVIVLETDYAIGDTINLEFTHPVEVHSGQIIYDEIRVNQEDTPARFLQAKESVTPNIFFQTITNRTFEDKLLATQEDIDAIVGGSQYKGSYDAFTRLT